MRPQASRRDFLAASASLAGAGVYGSTVKAASAASDKSSPGFRYCLNFATLQGYKSGLVEMVEVAAQAGYQAIEPWVNGLHGYEDQAGSLPDLRRRIADLGLTVESAIAFPQWIVDDPGKRAIGMEQAKRDMDVVARIGGKRIAAPPAGANSGPEIALLEITHRYRALLELGDQMGVVPELEFWGTSANLRQLSQAVFVAIEVDHPKACVLADVFHLYKGQSGFLGLRLLSSQAVQVIHLNDYPASPGTGWRRPFFSGLPQPAFAALILLIAPPAPRPQKSRRTGYGADAPVHKPWLQSAPAQPAEGEAPPLLLVAPLVSLLNFAMARIRAATYAVKRPTQEVAR